MNTEQKPKINPNAKVREINGVDAKIYEEYRQLTGEDLRLAMQHLNQSIKDNTAPVPVKDWVHCPHPECSYRCPGNLINHITKQHGGLQPLATELGLLPQQIVICTDAALEKYKAAGAKGTAAAQAKKAAAAEVIAPTTDVPGL